MRPSLVLAPCLLLATLAHAGLDPTRVVDPFIGTGGHGHTFPGATLPFGMVQLSPDTRLDGWDGCSGYHDDDTVVYGFSHTHLSGTGVSDYGDVSFLPGVGTPQGHTSYGRTLGDGDGARFAKASEHAEPGFYTVTLSDSRIKVELTATERTGWHRFTFPAAESAYVRVDLASRDEVLASSVRVVDDHTIKGERRSRAWARDQRVFFVARFSQPFRARMIVGGVPLPGAREADGRDVRVALFFDAARGARVVAKVGISAVDVAGARAALATEAKGWDFDAVRARARATWRRALSRIEVTGATPAQDTTFYTALYHTMLQPNLYTDVDGRYRGRDGEVHVAKGWTQYTVFSLWDTFRAAHPLYTILEPERTRDFIETFLAQYREGGRLPVWELAGNETDCMIGYHAVSVIADAWAKGIRGFDAAAALTAMRASAESDARGLADYRVRGYVPGERESEGVSKTLEYAYDDWCIAGLADALGETVVRDRYLERAQGWRHLLDPATGFMRPRINGRFKTPFDPSEVDFHFTEANSWQYSFFVPQDIAGHIEALGGRARYAAKLDSLFTVSSRTTGREQADITGLIGQYAHGNEPSHHIAYLYDYAGQPWKTQAMVRRILDSLYTTGHDGLAGNEDCGQMSAWYVMSALGLYAVTPGQEQYANRVAALPARRDPSAEWAHIHDRRSGRGAGATVYPARVPERRAAHALRVAACRDPVGWHTRVRDGRGPRDHLGLAARVRAAVAHDRASRAAGARARGWRLAFPWRADPASGERRSERAHRMDPARG
jgi:predicted alpha-1,2-mannosidase